jgi:ceramide glucosyltransferase
MMIIFLSLALLSLLCIASAYFLFTIYAGWRFFRQPVSSAPVTLPPVALFKPLKGATPELYEQLASFCRLDYPCFQLLCGVRDPQDPAVTVVKQLQHDFPTCDITLRTNLPIIGANAKVSTLHRLAQEARYDIFVISDSDVSVPPDYLQRLIPPLLDSGIGLVTCPYRGEVAASFPACLESLMINTSFAPQVLVASQVEKTTYAFGATMAITRQCLDKIGGFLTLADYLADDYYLGYFVTQAGYKARIVLPVVETHPGVSTFSELFHHQVRWSRTQRTCRPGGYYSTLITYGTVWAFLGLLFFWSSSLLYSLALGTLGLRLLSAGIVGGVLLGSSLTLRTLWLVPLADVVSFVVWAVSLFGNTVRWGEYTFRVNRDGKMHPLTTLPPISPHTPPTDATEGEPQLEKTVRIARNSPL